MGTIMNEIGFIGAGNMATAIIKGYIGKAESDIFVYDINCQQVEKLEAKAYRTPTEEQTLKQLKKQKLEGKTRLHAILDGYNEQEGN